MLVATEYQNTYLPFGLAGGRRAAPGDFAQDDILSAVLLPPIKPKLVITGEKKWILNLLYQCHTTTLLTVARRGRMVVMMMMMTTRCSSSGS